MSPEGDVWLATYDGFVLRWRQGAFEAMPVPPSALYWKIDISGTSASDVWLAGGKDDVFHWDGSTMTRVALEPGLTYHAVDARAVDDVSIQGYSDPGEARYLRFDGRAWTTMAEGGPRTKTFHVVESGDIWGVDGFVYRWNGATWATALDFGNEWLALDHSWAASDEEVWAAGYGTNSTAALFHWDGQEWVDESTLIDSEPINALWRSPGGALWTVGMRGTTYRRDANGWQKLHEEDPPLLESYPIDQFGNSAPIIAGRDEDEVWVTGHEGRLRRYLNGAWISLP